ncbi:MAG: LysR substrate-binding domain-containing protein [Pigmentiphaga sp.]|nr:LysR substrate-binding domain-containing protein [Pigmentiphaga sp.]
MKKTDPEGTPASDGPEASRAGRAQIDRYLKNGLKIRHLRVLLAAAELGRISRVAEQFDVSQPAISKQISEVEAALGVRLFERQGHVLRLTNAGEHMMRSANAMVVEIEELAERLGSMGAGITGKVALGGVATTFIVFAPQAVARFKARAPHAALSLIDGSGDELLAALRAGEIDLFVGRLGSRAVPADVRSEDLLDDPTVIVSGTDHPLARKPKLEWSHLAGQEWIVPPINLPEYRNMLQWLDEHGVHPPVGSIESRSLLANLQLIATGRYLSLMPRAAAIQLAHQGRLSLLKFPPATAVGPLQLVWLEARQSPAARLLAECLRDVARELV